MRWLALMLVLLAALAHAPAANAHAAPIRSEPADRAVVAQSPATVTLTFNEPVSPLVLRLVGDGGHSVELTDVTAVNAALAVRLPATLPQGTHLLSWRVISADGHPVGGTLTFSVGQPSASPPAARLDSDRRLMGAFWAVKLVLYAGLFIGIGGAFHASWIASPPLPPRTVTILAAVLQCGLVAAVLSVGLQGVDALGLPPSDLRLPRVWAKGLATSFGLTAGIAAVAFVLGHGALRAGVRLSRGLSALALVGVGLALATSGHASSAGALMRPVVFLHVVAVAFWVGALLPLVVMLRGGGRLDELAWFSRAIPWPLAVLVATGIVLAVVQLQQIDALWNTSYGLVLSGKLAAVIVLLGSAAANRWLAPRVLAGDVRAGHRMARSIAAELAIVIVIFGLVASWRFTPPPRSLAAAAAEPIHVHIHAAQAMAVIKIEPARAGRRAVQLTILNGEFGPLPAKEVTLVLSKPDAGIEPIRLPATHVEATVWQVDGLSLPVAGRWRARVEILITDFEKVGIEDEIDLR